MGVLRKRQGTRGTEGGSKYTCDVCGADITSTVRIRCANPICENFDLCVPCFAEGASAKDHDPRTHEFSVVEQHSIPIYVEDWGADEEMLLLEGAETYGLGSWADIADHIGGYRTKDEVRDHYINTYVNSSNFPLPERADPKDISLALEIPRDEFQAKKKRRIEERKEAAKNAPPAAPKQKPTASVPSCHEVQGYMPGRLEFETEFANEAEEAVQHMQFETSECASALSNEPDPELDLKMVVMDIYNSRLTARAERKKIIFEHGLLEYRKNTAIDKKRTKEERELFGKCKPFVRMCNHGEFDELARGIEYEHNLRQAIGQLQDWRQMCIGDLKTGERYEADKLQRAARPPPTGSFDRLAGARPKPIVVPETPSETTRLVAPELPERLKAVLRPARAQAALEGRIKGPLTNGNANGGAGRPRHETLPLQGVAPLKMNGDTAPDLHLLTREEKQLCETLRLMPKAYLVVKEGLMKEAMKVGGGLRRKHVRELCKIDATKASRIYDFFIHAGWIQRLG